MLPAPGPGGWLVLGTLTLVASVLFLTRIYPFLSPNRPLTGGALVIGGGADDSALRAAATLLGNGTYEKLIVIGTPISKGQVLLPYQSDAELGVDRLQKLMDGGVPASPVRMENGKSDGCFASAKATHDWMQAHGGIPSNITVFCSPASSRRCRLAYSAVFGASVHIGMIAGAPIDYDPQRWWISSAGVRDVINQCIAYGYVRVGYGRPER